MNQQNLLLGTFRKNCTLFTSILTTYNLHNDAVEKNKFSATKHYFSEYYFSQVINKRLYATIDKICLMGGDKNRSAIIKNFPFNTQDILSDKNHGLESNDTDFFKISDR